MKRLAIISLMLLTTLLLISTQKAIIIAGQSENAYYSMTSTITYSNPASGSKIWNITEDDRTIGLFMNNSWQTVELKNATYAMNDIRTDEDGNKIGLLELPKQQLVPGENLTFTTEHQIVAKPRSIPDISESESGILDEVPSGLVQEYTSSEGPWSLNDHIVHDLAQEIAGNETKVLTILAELISWIKENIKYGTHEIPLYPDQTLDAGNGDCDEQAILLVALLRTLGIPSYLQIGALYLPQYTEVSQNHWDNHVQTVQRKMGWHGWAIAFVPPWGWLPVDLTFVPEGFEDPLNAVRYAVVAKQITVQYMNVSRVDYIASSLEVRSFLTENGFLVHVEEEMTKVTYEGDNGVYPDVTVIVTAVIVAVVLLTVIAIVRHRGKKLKKQKPLRPEEAS